MSEYILRTVFVWTYRGILCTCRFLWICPYNAVKFLPRQTHVVEDKSRQVKGFLGYENKVTAAIPGSPDRMNALHKRLTKTEKEILSIKTRITCERASWEKRFTELHRQLAELRKQPALEDGLLMKEDTCYDQERSELENGDVFDECSSVFHQCKKSQTSSRMDHCACCSSGNQTSSSTLSSRPTSSLSSSSSFSSSCVQSWKSSLHRVFVPHSPMDLQLGHRVRIMLPSGRISTGTVRFVGQLQGESELHLGVELQTPDPSLSNGSHMGQSYFKCKPGYGAFVPFHKLLMAWE